MDITNKYIEMSELSDLQKQLDFTGVSGVVGFHFDNRGYMYCGKRVAYNAMKNICLLRQDELQKISGLTWNSFDERCNLIAYEYWGRIGKRYEDIGDMYKLISKEQAGLMVVMKQKFNQVWDGKEWVKD